jgi:long-chain acyl-CoA synthetase
MKGYYREPEKSAGVFVDGWYHSGDSGRFDNNGNLWITGRIGDAFEMADGNCIRPAELEGRFDAVPDIAQMMVCGHGREQLVMLLNLTEQARLRKRAALILELERTLGEVNAELPAQSRIARLFVTRDQWSVANRLLTPAMTLKRRDIMQRYSGFIDAGCDAGRIVFE